MLTAFVWVEETAFKIPDNWPKPKYDFTKNPLSENKIELGRILFYDPILSKDSSISCSSCHLQYTAFTHMDHALSHGIGDSMGTRNAPALMNLAWHSNFMWDGAINHLDVQSLAPISHPDEMGENIVSVVYKLNRNKKYRHLFAASYHLSSITGEQVLKSISQFMLTLVSSHSKYDSVMRKQSLFTNQEKNGYALFQKNCSSCHTEPLFSNFQFVNNGLALDPDLRDYGRMKISGDAKDSLKFKIPSLRNIEFSSPYMHDGRFKTLNQVLNHYTKGIQKNNTLAKELETPIILSANEKVDLIAFLITLTDRQFLFNPAYGFPK